MKQIKDFYGLGVALLLLFVATTPAKASTLFWGSRFNDVLLDSAGNALDASYTFELGAFDSSFTPTAFNLEQWAANWNVFDAALVGDGWAPDDQFINSSADHNALGGSDSLDANPLDIFPQSTVAYLWVFNNKDVALQPEWALLMDGNTATNVLNTWEFPDPALQSGESFDLQTRDLDTAVFGGVNGVQGAGNYTVDPSTYTFQTHVVPEPGGAFMLLVAGGLWRLRRSKRLAAF